MKKVTLVRGVACISDNAQNKTYVQSFKDEAQTAVFKYLVRTAQ
jgi:hypothetical protein